MSEQIPKGERPVELRASIVPFSGGQGLMLTVVYSTPTDLSNKIECLDFMMVDHENGQLADAPPNGHASPVALRRVSPLIAKCISELEHEDFELRVDRLMCGQGLTEHVDLIDESLKSGYGGDEGCPYPPIMGVLVYASSSTGASQAAGGVPPPQPVFGDPNAMAAMLQQVLGNF